MRNAHYRTCNMARKPKNVEKETHTHYRTWNMARNTENVENEKRAL